MAAINQNFDIYLGDDLGPVFTVLDASGQPIDISGVTDIQWIGYLKSHLSPLISKKKSLGTILFVNTGSDGKLQVLIDKTDTVGMKMGWYFHSVIITLPSTDTITVATGRFAVLDRGQTS